MHLSQIIRQITLIIIMAGLISAPSLAAPSAPFNVIGQSALRTEAPHGAVVSLQWRTMLIVRGCRVYRDGKRVAVCGLNLARVWRFSDTQVLPGETYRYTVTALDVRLRESAPSAPVTVVIPPLPVALPTPILVTARSDDRSALLSWGVSGTINQSPDQAGPLRPDQQEPGGVTGFLVTWGPQDGSAPQQKLSVERLVQLQPLTPGVRYQATVQSVDSQGNTSLPSAPVSFVHDPSRVDALRTQMTGFFDDFNTPAGLFDEQKWNTSYAAGDDPALSGAFVNSQFHAHDMVSNQHGFGDREWVMNRPRAVFDVTNRTGTLVFDMDGEFRRDQWYLDLVPADYAKSVPDTTGQAHLEDMTTAAHPGNYIRLHQSGQTVEILYINKAGMETRIARTDWTSQNGLSGAPLDWQGLKLIPNVRRHWKVTFSRTHCQVSVDDVPILAGDYDLDYERVVPLWLAFSYNTLKGNVPVMLLHWDNFGFDGPSSPVTTHNYKVTLDSSDFTEMPYGGTHAYTLHIPDSLAGATARRMMLSLTCRSVFYQWTAGDHVGINGHDLAISEPVSPTGLPSSSLVSGTSGFPVVLDVPDNIFRTGDNTITVALASGGVMNVHAEFDFPQGAAPIYTTPMAIYDPDCAGGVCPPGEVMPGMPTMPTAGPGVYFSKLGGTATPYLSADTLPGLVLPVSQGTNYGSGQGIVPVEVTVTCDTDLAASGTIHGCRDVALLVDGQIMRTQLMNAVVAAPGGKVVFWVDTTKLTPGSHALLAAAHAPDGTAGGVDYDGALGKPDQDYSLHINVQP